jgi:hypothetical protein
LAVNDPVTWIAFWFVPGVPNHTSRVPIAVDFEAPVMWTAPLLAFPLVERKNITATDPSTPMPAT